MHSTLKRLFPVFILIQAFLCGVWIYLYRDKMNIFQGLSTDKIMETPQQTKSYTSNPLGLDWSTEETKQNRKFKLIPTEEIKRKRKCTLIPPGLVGQLIIDKEPHSWDSIEKKYSTVNNGRYSPENCEARQKVAILIPFRDRESHLKVFLNHIHAFLMKQQLEYGIYVVEQIKGLEFNRGFLFNVGFKEANKDFDYDCFILHDVDLLPENDHNIYTCPIDQPKHLSTHVDKWQYKMIYDSYFGGVSVMTKEQYKEINGFSNKFFGWGGEDDDLYSRVIWSNMSIYRVINGVARYTSLQHKPAKGNPKRMEILSTGRERMSRDGLNTLKYTLLQKTYKKLFVHFIVNITLEANFV